MPRPRPFLTGALCGALALTPATPALAQGGADAPADALVVFSGGVNAMMPDDKDAPLREGLTLLGDRLAELPMEIPDFGAPPALLRMGYALLTGPMTLRLAPRTAEDVEARGGAPISLLLHATPDVGGRQIADTVTDMMAGGGMELRPSDAPGLVRTDTPAGGLYLGTTGDQRAFTLGLNATDGPRPFGATELPAGIEPVMGFRADLGALSSMLEAAAPPDDEFLELMDVLGRYGLAGENAMTIEAAAGYCDRHAHGVARFGGYRRAMGGSIPGPDVLINADHLRLVPRDATRLTAGVFDLSAGLAQLEEMVEMTGEEFDLVEQIEAETGIHLQRDILDALGQRFMSYQSDTTGGGGFLSTVAMVELTDPGRLAETHAKIVDLINHLGADLARGYVRVGVVEPRRRGRLQPDLPPACPYRSRSRGRSPVAC